MNKKVKVTRREKRRHLEQFHLAVEMTKVIKHFHPASCDTKITSRQKEVRQQDRHAENGPQSRCQCRASDSHIERIHENIVQYHIGNRIDMTPAGLPIKLSI